MVNNVLALIDGLEQRLALIVCVGAVAFSAADPTALSPKWAALIVAAQAVAGKLLASPVVPVVAAPVVVPAAPTDAQVNAELP